MPQLDATHDPALRSWVSSAHLHPDFPIQNLPLGIFSPLAGAPRGGIAIGDQILDLRALHATGLLDGEAQSACHACAGPTLNAFLALGASSRAALRQAISALLAAGAAEQPALLHDAADCILYMPAKVGDYTDLYAGIHHATAVGKLFRPDNPLLPNYKWVPIGYHGRASSIRVSGSEVRRPNGQRKYPDRPEPSFGPCRTARLRARTGHLGRCRQRARHDHPDRRGKQPCRRLLPAERLVRPRPPGLGVSAARPVPGQELRIPRSPPGSSPRKPSPRFAPPSPRVPMVTRPRCPTCKTRRTPVRARWTWSSRCCC